MVVGAAGVSGMRNRSLLWGRTMWLPHRPNNPSDIAWDVLSTLESPEKMKWLGKNGRKRVLAEFTWSKIAKHTLDLYETIAKR